MFAISPTGEVFTIQCHTWTLAFHAFCSSKNILQPNKKKYICLNLGSMQTVFRCVLNNLFFFGGGAQNFQIAGVAAHVVSLQVAFETFLDDLEPPLKLVGKHPLTRPPSPPRKKEHIFPRKTRNPGWIFCQGADAQRMDSYISYICAITCTSSRSVLKIQWVKLGGENTSQVWYLGVICVPIRLPYFWWGDLPHTIWCESSNKIRKHCRVCLSHPRDEGIAKLVGYESIKIGR